jgi:hypothetical protein
MGRPKKASLRRDKYRIFRRIRQLFNPGKSSQKSGVLDAGKYGILISERRGEGERNRNIPYFPAYKTLDF